MRIDRPVVDVYRGPGSRSGRVNQLLYNEIVVRIAKRGDFVRVRSSDGYVGWIQEYHVAGLTQTKHTHLVDVPVASLLNDSANLFVGKLSYGTRISILEESGSFGRLNFLGKPVWISLGCVKRLSRSTLRWRSLRRYLVNMIGTPYLWGGRSGFGLDCSGLVQLVFNSCGYNLPRDSAQQRKHGRRISLRNLAPGDLIFSPGHVCIYFGQGFAVHSSMRAGGVYVQDLLSGAPDSRTDICSRIELAKRVIRAT